MFSRWRFYKAIEREDLDTVTALLTKKPKLAKLESKEYLEGPIGKATRCKNKKILEAILSAGADVNSSEAQHVLDIAANNDEVVRLLRNHGANVNETNFKGWTPLHRAADWCYHRTVRLLLEYGAEVNAKDEDGQPPLDKAQRSCSREPTADEQKTINILREHDGVETAPAAPEPEQKCFHHFSWIDRAGFSCDVCGASISSELLSEGRGKVCQKCGLAVHINCQDRLS